MAAQNLNISTPFWVLGLIQLSFSLQLLTVLLYCSHTLFASHIFYLPKLSWTPIFIISIQWGWSALFELLPVMCPPHTHIGSRKKGGKSDRKRVKVILGLIFFRFLKSQPSCACFSVSESCCFSCLDCFSGCLHWQTKILYPVLVLNPLFLIKHWDNTQLFSAPQRSTHSILFHGMKYSLILEPTIKPMKII
jgi:hypothetical protein